MAEYYNYTTIQGDTFDAIALDFYNNEQYDYKIMDANPEHISTIVFSAGVKLKIPVIQESAPETLPPWKRGYV